MTGIDAALAALETVCSSVSFVKNEDDPLPDSYVVLSVLDDTPEIYAGDRDEQQHLIYKDRDGHLAIGVFKDLQESREHGCTALSFSITETQQEAVKYDPV